MDQEEPSNLAVDPLANVDTEAETETTSSEPAEEVVAADQYTQEQLVEILSKVTEVDFSDEYMDPIEWSVRKVVPLPAVYYWDLLKDLDEDVAKKIVQEKIPRKIRAWHRFIGSMDRAQHFINDWIAQPVASTIGITDSRISYVTDTMTEEDMRKSKRIVAERKKRQEENSAKESA